jgi:cell pole-organizing protein PopZ
MEFAGIDFLNREAHMNIPGTKLVISALLMVTAQGAQAQIMKCVGKDGRVEFAATCPPGTQQQATGVSTSKPAPAPAPAAAKDGTKDSKDSAAPKSLADRDAEFRKRQADQKAAEEKTAQKTTQDADRQRACQSAQSNLQALKSRQRLYRTDPKTGERVFYEEADYLRELPLTERNVAEYCKS